MCSNDLETSILGVKFVSNIEGDNSGVVSSEEVFATWLQGPIFNLVQLLVSFLSELLTTPIDCVIRWNWVVDEFQKRLS